jgi:hypothetical protein
MTRVSLHPTNPMFVLKHLLPVPISKTFERSVRPWTSQNPRPFYPIWPKSWAQSISKYALFYLQTLWYVLRSGESESIEKRPYVTTRIALSGSFFLTSVRVLIISYWSKWENLCIFFVAALAPYWRQLWESLSITMWSSSLISAFMTPKPANHPAE